MNSNWNNLELFQSGRFNTLLYILKTSFFFFLFSIGNVTSIVIMSYFTINHTICLWRCLFLENTSHKTDLNPNKLYVTRSGLANWIEYKWYSGSGSKGIKYGISSIDDDRTTNSVLTYIPLICAFDRITFKRKCMYVNRTKKKIQILVV